MADTLPPTEFIDPQIPIVTPDGGSNAAYKNPNSAESILKKTKSLEVQSQVDRKFDVAVNPYEESFTTEYTMNKMTFWNVLVLIAVVYGFSSYKHVDSKDRFIFIITLVFFLILTYPSIVERVWKQIM